MNAKDFEIFYNWNNSLNTNDKIQYRVIQERIQPMLAKKAYKESEIEEILIAEGYKENLVKEAMKASAAPGKKPENTEQAVEAAHGVPKRYADMAHRFEKALVAHGPSKFVKMLTQGENPLVKMSQKEVDTLQRIADQAFENPLYLESLHSYIQPSIVSELADNVCKARKIQSKCKIAKTHSGYRITHGEKVVEASIKPVKSTSEKFAQSNYEAFGFPDEYVILAYEEESPYAQIKRDLNR